MREFSGLVLLAAVLALCTPAQANDDPAEEMADERVGEVIARIKSLPEADLKKFYQRCNRAAIRGQLGSGEIALCSVGYETLLQRHFGGDFHALLAWRRNPDGKPEPARPSPF